MAEIIKGLNYNANELTIPFNKLEIGHHSYLSGYLYKINIDCDYSLKTLSSISNGAQVIRTFNMDIISDLNNVCEGQTLSEFNEQVKRLETIEYLMIDCISNLLNCSKDEAIIQWIVFANIKNLDHTSRVARVTSKYAKQHTEFLKKLIELNPKFSNKINNLNEFGFVDVNNTKELQLRLKKEFRKNGLNPDSVNNTVDNSGCMLMFFAGFILILIM